MCFNTRIAAVDFTVIVRDNELRKHISYTVASLVTK